MKKQEAVKNPKKPDVTYSDLPYNHIAGQNNTYNNTQKVKDIDVRKIKKDQNAKTK